jgi:hypothetical protein
MKILGLGSHGRRLSYDNNGQNAEKDCQRLTILCTKHQNQYQLTPR